MIISRYLFKEILYTLLALSSLLILIYVSHRFMAYITKASVGKIPAEFIFQLLGLKLLSDLILILPLGFFLALLLSLGRLYKDNEITALAACGIPVPIVSIASFGFIFAIVIGTLSLILAPWAENQQDVLQIQLKSAAEVGGIAAGRFKEFNHGNGIFYVEKVEADDMRVLFIQANLPKKQVILVANKGYQKEQGDDLFMVLVDGYRYENAHGKLNYTITKFEEHKIKIPKLVTASHDQKHDAMPTNELWFSDQPALQAELQWRLSFPLSVILLAILAVPLSHTTPRQGQYSKIVSGILIYLIYNNLLNVAKKWVERGDVSPIIGVWWVHIILVLIIVALFHLPELKRWINLLLRPVYSFFSKLISRIKVIGITH
ncbi:LPS export ABC transporter permease LptF [Candidatus Halobeggiatoa sp. HSG11]|nr:LPS export ABC transporter permease LptF [Candidatus Halobeggiatoa sp. HSG11]